MSGSSQAKTEHPTPSRLRKLRRQGQAPQSPTFASSVHLVVTAGMLATFGPALGRTIRDETASILTMATEPPRATSILNPAIQAGASLLVPLVLIVTIPMAAAVLVSFLQVGGILTMDPLVPKLNRMHPWTGLKQRVFSLRAAMEFLKSLVLMVLVSTILCVILRNHLPTIVRAGAAPVEDLVTITWMIVRSLILWGAGSFLVIGVADLLYQRWQFIRDHRMSLEDVKQEYKDQEGDAQAKAQRKRFHQELLASSMLERTREADVVVVNPTHIACALSFRPDLGDLAPRMVACGRGALAARIREIAIEGGIPVRRDVELARSLVRLDVEQMIPEDLYPVVAALFRAIEAESVRRSSRPAWIASPTS